MARPNGNGANDNSIKYKLSLAESLHLPCLATDIILPTVYRSNSMTFSLPCGLTSKLLCFPQKTASNNQCSMGENNGGRGGKGLLHCPILLEKNEWRERNREEKAFKIDLSCIVSHSYGIKCSNHKFGTAIPIPTRPKQSKRLQCTWDWSQETAMHVGLEFSYQGMFCWLANWIKYKAVIADAQKKT